MTCEIFFLQLEDPAIRWQMALYKDLPNRTEDSSDPEKTVERVLDIANVLFHLEQVRLVLPIPLLLNLNRFLLSPIILYILLLYIIITILYIIMWHSFFFLVMATVCMLNPGFCSPISWLYLSHSVFAAAPTTFCLASQAN